MKNQLTEIEPFNVRDFSGKLQYWTGDLGGRAVIFFGVVALFHFLYLNFHWGGDEYLDAVNDGVSLIIYMGATMMLWRTSSNENLPFRSSRAWRLFTVAFFCSTAGGVLWFYLNVIAKTQPYPSLADLFYLCYYPLMFWGLLLAAPKLQTGEERVRLSLDAAIVLLGSGMLLWYFLLQPIAQAATGDWTLTALSLCYPAFDLLMFFGITIVLFKRSSSEISWALNLLLAGLVILFLADLLFCYQNLQGTYKNGEVADILYSISCFLVILGAHIQYKSASSEAQAEMVQNKPKTFSWMPYFGIAAGYGLLLTFVFDEPDTILSHLIIIAVALTLLVVLRQVMSIRENVRAKEAFRELQERFQGIYDSSKDAIAFASFDGTLIDVNEAFASLLGYSQEELLEGKTFHQLTPVEYHQINAEHIRKTIDHEQSPEYEKEYLKKDGSRVPVSVTSFAVKGSDGKPMGLAAIIRDITERKRAEEQLRHNALHDALTNLPNRALFHEHVQTAIHQNQRRKDSLFGVVFLDLDRFKVINDSLGHLEGDKLLIAIAQRLRSSLRPGDIVARLGGDEFTVLLNDLQSLEKTRDVVKRIENSLKKPFRLSEREVAISASIGIALSSPGYKKPEELMRDADTAMYHAKAAGKAQYKFFSPAMHDEANNRYQLETALPRALENGEFCLHYQPIVELSSDRIIGFESLVHWQHPQRGLISPDEFIPIAEETGLIVPLGEWILHESCRQVRVWQREDDANADLTINVNLSSRQFTQIDLADKIAEILLETELAPQYLCLEVTESHFLKDSELAIEIMDRLRVIGVRLSIDDFGTGYSSLSYLHRLPINSLKIDRSFISKMQTNHDNVEIVRTIIMLADSLKIEVVAEGIETREQLSQLNDLGCQNGQGYLFSKPVPGDQVNALLAAHHNNLDEVPSAEFETREVFEEAVV
jgi:diguanylate cyclase (GGDEF)-like protein/PAS domain S-box-containing protein